MGSQESCETMPQNPLIKKIVQCLYLLPFKQNLTFSLAHRYFANQFARIEKAKFDRSMNPFCPIRIKDTEKYTTCCLVSPLLAIVLGHDITTKGNNKGKIEKQCQIYPVYQRMETTIAAEDAYLAGDGNIGLIFLEVPYWRVGWAGVSYVTGMQQLIKLDLKIVCHPEKTVNKEQNKTLYIQEVRRLKVPKTSQLDSNFCIQVNGVAGSIVCKMVDKKPFMIGIQISETQIKFIDQALFKAMQDKCKQYIRERGEKEILKQMDIHELEIETEL